MKRVVFGYGGGFPLEQETLMQIQEAYSEDMLEALFAQWGLDSGKKYLIKKATENEDGWVVLPIEILVEGKEDTSEGRKETKLQLVRLLYNKGGTRVSVEDVRAGEKGSLQYASGTKNKVYEEFIAKLVLSGGNYDLSNFNKLKTIKELTDEVSNNEIQINTIKEAYLPRNGSKPMTGNLHLGEEKSSVTNGEDGTKLFFKGTGNNTDNVFINKHTPSSDTTELRVSIGDNTDQGGRDAFVVGGAVAGQETWREKFRVQTDGKVGIGVSDPDKSLEVDARGESLKFKNLGEVDSQTPLVVDSEGNVGKNTNGIGSADFSVGMIMMWSGDVNTVPKGWLLCDGNKGVKINNQTIPDLRGRFIAGYSKGTVDYGNIGSSNKGVENVKLTNSNMPEHSHSMNFRYSGAEQDNQISFLQPTHFTDSNPQGEGGGDGTGGASGGVTINTESSGVKFPIPIENRPPYYVLAFIIYVGDYNVLPVVNAGKNQIVKLPTNSATLSGSASDSDGTISSTIWSQGSSNPSGAVIVSNNTLTTQVTGLVQGNYTFKLTVKDNEGAVVNDTVVIAVHAPVIFSAFGVLKFKLDGSPQNNIPIGIDGKVKVRMSSSYNWQLENKPDFMTITPNSGSGTEVLTVTIEPTSVKRSGTISFLNENNERASLAWSQESIVIGPGGGGGGGGCFDLESDVLMATGRSKKLKNIVVGDELRVFGFTKLLPAGKEEFRLLSELIKGATKEVGKVVDFGTKKVSEYRKITLLNGEILHVTPSHPILASRDKEEVAWLLPDDLRGGYYIVDKNGVLVEIESKKTIKEPLEIGLLQLEKGDNYFVEGCMVHNAKIIRAEARVVGDIEAKPIARVDVLDKLPEEVSIRNN